LTTESAGNIDFTKLPVSLSTLTGKIDLQLITYSRVTKL